MMDQKAKPKQNGAKSFPGKLLKPFGKSVRRQSEHRMPADVLAKLIIAAVTGILLLGLLISFLVPSSRKPDTKTSTKSYEEKLEYARKKRHEGKELIRESYNSDLAKTRNELLKQAEDILWESRETYTELIDAHDDRDYEYLQTEIAEVQTYIYHCQKTRTIVEFE